MISYPWTVNWKAQGQDIEEFKYFKRWFEETGRAPGVQRGMAVGADLSEDQSKLPPRNASGGRRSCTTSAPGRCRRNRPPSPCPLRP